jgi:hypothetical protein
MGIGRVDEQHVVAASLKLVWNAVDLNAETGV